MMTPYPSEIHVSPQVQLPTKHIHLGEIDDACIVD